MKNTMKLGDMRSVNAETKMWGYEIKTLWLCKNEHKQYIVMGLCKDEHNTSHGWCTMFSGTLAEARRYAEVH